ncbi:hypothetical protein A2Z00_03750 [Candidatus Gottesmanbacteria bacterium RBG_13_45_10]|uniref:Uncharacterized protein n=1 Tax=Candidatus Gottesmanbacteria bacterium RBG_13_45_10 TaxID=1798370 RepID=A0A1F5ZHL0_9BACT|nr:MAG: hypothetical protein A2Z00_03750 [Candidatus Gottesmanbacteria bacterium RBG_13_45_10]
MHKQPTQAKTRKPKHVTSYETSDFYFDDCAICRGMKKAEEQGKNLNTEELKALFNKQNKQN